MKPFKILFVATILTIVFAGCNNGGEADEDNSGQHPDTTKVDSTTAFIDNHQIK